MTTATPSPLLKIRRYFLFILDCVLALAILVAVALTAQLAVGPISVAFPGPGPGIGAALSEQVYYAYDMNFDELELS